MQLFNSRGPGIDSDTDHDRPVFRETRLREKGSMEVHSRGDVKA